MDVQTLLTRYGEAKRALGAMTGASEDLLHIHAGLFIFVISAILLRRKMRSPVPLILVIFFAAANEVIDWISNKPAAPMEPLIDFLNTSFWPLMLFLIARRWR